MGRKLHWKPGSFYRKDDFSGFPVRAERTKKVWTGMIVDRARWEARQPQDLVKGVPDYQAVPEPRPLPPNQFVGPVYLEMSQSSAVGAFLIDVQSTALITPGDAGAIMLDNGVLWPVTIVGYGADSQICIWPPLPYPVSNDNMIIDYRTPGTYVPFLLTEGGAVILTEDGRPIEL